MTVVHYIDKLSKIKAIVTCRYCGKELFPKELINNQKQLSGKELVPNLSDLIINSKERYLRYSTTCCGLTIVYKVDTYKLNKELQKEYNVTKESEVISEHQAISDKKHNWLNK